MELAEGDEVSEGESGCCRSVFADDADEDADDEDAMGERIVIERK